jgi:hypothetical protein
VREDAFLPGGTLNAVPVQTRSRFAVKRAKKKGYLLIGNHKMA